MSDKYVAYVGSYTRGDSKGLHIFDFDPATLTFKLRDVFEINNPSVVHLSNDGRYSRALRMKVLHLLKF